MLFITIALHANYLSTPPSVTVLRLFMPLPKIRQEFVCWVLTTVSTVMMAITTIVILFPIPLIISASMRSVSRAACSIWLQAVECEIDTQKGTYASAPATESDGKRGVEKGGKGVCQCLI